MRTLIAYLLALCAIGVGVWIAWFDPFGAGPEGDPRGSGARPVPVIVATVVRAPFADSLEALGTAQANESVQLTANRTEHLVALHFEDGQEVEAGALLAELETAQERAMLAEAEALLAERRAAHRRAQELFEQQIASESEIDAAKAQLDAAQARVQTLLASIADHEIRAPFAGRLGLRHVSIGTLLQPSTVIATLDDLSVVKVDFTIPETWLSAVREGMPITGRTDAYAGETFAGEVTAIDTQLDRRTRSATVRAVVSNEDRRLRPGMLMKVLVDRGEAAVLQVPEEALVQVGEAHHVLVVGEDDVAHRVAVEVGRRRVGRVEVLSGLAGGERIVVEGLVRVRPGAPVEVVAQRGSGNGPGGAAEASTNGGNGSGSGG